MSIQDVQAAAEAVTDAQQQLREAVAAAQAAGVPDAAVARAAGVSRQTIINWTKKS